LDGFVPDVAVAGGELFEEGRVGGGHWDWEESRGY
jgi:hypothetical protein